MKSTFERCEICDDEIPTDRCVFVARKRVVDGKEYIFCCARCAEAFEKSKIGW